jgi:hypothetical protein
MNKYNIDDYTEFSNDEVFLVIKMVINGQIEEVAEDPTLKMFFISYLMKYITDEALLNSTLKLLFQSSWLKNLKPVTDLLLENVFPNLIYTEQDYIKIRAIVYSLLLEHEVNSRVIIYNNNNIDTPPFEFKVNGREIFYITLNEKRLNSLVDLTTKDIDKQTLSKSEKESEYNKVIRILHKIKRDEKTSFYDTNIQYLFALKETIIENFITNENEDLVKHDNFKFENNFDKVEPNKVYNYFFKKLVEKKYLSNEDLEKYLVLAFQDKKLPKEKFTFSNLQIEKIRTIFYTYFKDIAINTHGRNKEYAELLGEYFNGFTTQKVRNNFADGY